MAAPVEANLIFYHCEERSSLATNGGRLITTPIISGAMNNTFPHVLRAQRENGDKLFRKLALKIHQDGNGTLASCEFAIDGPTLGDDRILMFAGTATNRQSDIVDGNGVRLSGIRTYCAGGLAQPITAGSYTAVFAVKNSDDLAGVQVGDDFRLSDKLTPAATTGNVEYHTVAAKSVSGLFITLTTVSPIANSYAAYSNGTGGKVGVICKYGEVKAANGTITKSSTAGNFDAVTYPLEWNNMGADEHTIVHTFAPDGINFTAVSDRFGNLGTGAKTADFMPLHPTWSKALYKIKKEFWTGTWAGGDTLTTPTHAAAAYVWEERNVPVGCNPLGSNRVILVNRSEGL